MWWGIRKKDGLRVQSSDGNLNMEHPTNNRGRRCTEFWSEEANENKQLANE